MLTIRLSRVGKKKKPTYKIIVLEKEKDPWGDYLEQVGTYNPHTKETILKTDRIKHWISNGAQPSESVNNLLIKEGVIEGDKKKSVKISKKRLAKKVEKEKTDKPEIKPEAKADEKPAEEAPKEEVKEEIKTEEPKKEKTPKEEVKEPPSVKTPEDKDKKEESKPAEEKKEAPKDTK